MSKLGDCILWQENEETWTKAGIPSYLTGDSQFTQKSWKCTCPGSNSVTPLKNILGLYGQGNLIQNIFKIIKGEIRENDYKFIISSFKKEHHTAAWKGNFTVTLTALITKFFLVNYSNSIKRKLL